MRIFVFILSVFLLVSLTVSPAIGKQITKDQKIKKQKKQIEKQRQKNKELEDRLAASMQQQPKKEKDDWWANDRKKDCIGWSSSLATAGATIYGYGAGSQNDSSAKGAKIAGIAIVTGILIAQTDSSLQCITSGAMMGGGLGTWAGLKNKQHQEEKLKQEQQNSSTTSTGTGNTTSTGSNISSSGTNTTPGGGLPPPPPGAPRMNVEEKAGNVSIIPTFSPVSSGEKTGWAGTVVINIPFKKIPFIE
jgi:hypothetical protein